MRIAFIERSHERRLPKSTELPSKAVACAGSHSANPIRCERDTEIGSLGCSQSPEPIKQKATLVLGHERRPYVAYG